MKQKGLVSILLVLIGSVAAIDHGSAQGPCETVLDCPETKDCLINFCLEGRCLHGDFAAGIPCEDGDACTIGDSCVSGNCRSGARIPSCTERGLDDTGFVPKTRPGLRCINAAARKLGQYVAALVKCHAKAAVHSFKAAEPPEDEACQRKARLRFTDAVRRLSIEERCPEASCVMSNFNAIKNVFEQAADGYNFLLYCASPNGAFLDQDVHF